MATATSTAKQETGVRNGNEMAALSAAHINFHVMGYFPITPSTQVAEGLDEMKADGGHEVRMVPGDGEHGAAGICTGAALGGGRAFNVTAAQGLLYALEQLPSQAGLRAPMLLDIACRAINSPLNILCDHSDIMFALNTGWVILTARDPQMIYDMNLCAVKLGELPDVRLPVIVAYDGFFTSHQKRRVSYFAEPKDVQAWLGEYDAPFHALDPAHPVTLGPYMNAPDLINQKVQCAEAIQAAYRHLPEVLKDYAGFSGRNYGVVERYRTEDADVVLFLINSAFDTAKAAVDSLRAEGKKVGLLTTTVLRPFPVKEIQDALRSVKILVVGDRQDSYSTLGGNLSLEIRAALKDDPANRTQVFSRIYGIGGREFYADDGAAMLEEALGYAKTGQIEVRVAYHGADEGEPGYALPAKPASPIDRSQLTPPGLTVEVNPETGLVDVKGIRLRDLAGMPKRFSPGHGACPGCGIFPALNTFFKGIAGDVVVLFHTGCAMVVSTGYPFTSHNVSYVHNLFQNGAATLSGLVEMYHERMRRGEISEDITFVMVTGDGGNDIGMGPSIGAALRGHRMILVEYDNEGYMNTGAQLSYSTPLGHRTSTSHVGPQQAGKRFQHKDTPQIMAACNIPYVFTGCEAFPLDLIRKGAKAQHYAKNHGFVYGKILSCCPLSWTHESNAGVGILRKAVECNFFPLYEIEQHRTVLTYDPEKSKKKVDVTEWLKTMGKTRHLIRPENEGEVEAFRQEVDRRYARLKTLSEHPDL